jgi:hypothetical protein
VATLDSHETEVSDVSPHVHRGELVLSSRLESSNGRYAHHSNGSALRSSVITVAVWIACDSNQKFRWKVNGCACLNRTFTFFTFTNTRRAGGRYLYRSTYMCSDFPGLFMTQFLHSQPSSHSPRTSPTVSGSRGRESGLSPPFTVHVIALHCRATRDVQIPAPQPVHCGALDSGGLVDRRGHTSTVRFRAPCLFVLRGREHLSPGNLQHKLRVAFGDGRVWQYRLCCLGVPYSHPILTNLHHRSNQGTSMCAVHYIIVPLLRPRLWYRSDIPCKFQRYFDRIVLTVWRLPTSLAL